MIARNKDLQFNQSAKLSKNQLRKARRYGKKLTGSLRLESEKKLETDTQLKQFIMMLLQRPISKGHDDEDWLFTESGKRRYPLLPGSYETGKRR